MGIAICFASDADVQLPSTNGGWDALWGANTLYGGHTECIRVLDWSSSCLSVENSLILQTGEISMGTSL